MRGSGSFIKYALRTDCMIYSINRKSNKRIMMLKLIVLITQIRFTMRYLNSFYISNQESNITSLYRYNPPKEYLVDEI